MIAGSEETVAPGTELSPPGRRRPGGMHGGARSLAMLIAMLLVACFARVGAAQQAGTPLPGAPPPGAPDRPAVAAPPPGERPRFEISLLTMSPGRELFTAYGHTAIPVRPPTDPRQDWTYDYGTYDASDPDAPLQFMRGKLPYWVSVDRTADVLRWYGRAFSGITEQVLDLEPAQAEALAARLAENALPENREYAYHHFRDNCATKPRDLLDEAFGGALRRATAQAPSGATLRLLIDRSMAWAPYFRWPVYGLLNGRIDEPISRWEAMFLPAFLRDEVEALRVERPGRGQVPVVRERRIVVGEEWPARLPDPSPWAGLVTCLGLALLSSVLLVLRRRLPRLARVAQGLWLALWGLAAGGYGTLIAVTWAVSPYPETKWNGNLLLIHPLLLLLVPCGLLLAAGRESGRRWTIRLLLLALPGIAVAVLLDGLGLVTQHLIGFALAAACVALPALLGITLTGTLEPETGTEAAPVARVQEKGVRP